MGIVVVPLMGIAFPGKVMVGYMLPLLLVGDIIAVSRFHKFTSWRLLLKLIPFVALGMIPGFIVLQYISKEAFMPFLGILILMLTVIELLRRKGYWTGVPDHYLFGPSMGFLAGFGTAVGHAAGPVMGLFLLSRKQAKQEFMGTRAWFFLMVNAAKLPVYIPMGLMDRTTLKADVYLLPMVLIGVAVGFFLLSRIPPKVFNNTVLVLAAAAAVKMVLM